MNQWNCGLTGRVIVPADPFYHQARQGFNRAVEQYPSMLVYCRNAAEVSNAVIWARACQIPIRIRNGGHNYEGYSNGNGTLVIDISEMDQQWLDESRRILHVQGGATNGKIYGFISPKGYAFPGGTCPTVGISGYTAGGGWGLSSRWLGLGCDSLEELELINAQGQLLQASPSCHSDLFWACRGAGGGNFGVIVSMKFRLPPKVDFVTLIELDYLHVTAPQQEAFLQVWQSWLPDADPRATLIARVYHSPADGLAMLVRGIFYGGAQEAQALMQPFLELPGVRFRFSYLTFLEAVTILGNGYPPYERFQAVSRYALREWTPAETAGLVRLIRRPARGSVFAGLSLYALGGRVAQVPQEETAFYYRHAHFIVWLETIWEDPAFRQENQRWLHCRFPALAKVTAGSYVNFPYRRLPSYREEYFGRHVSRLWEVKKRYDPCNVFSFPQGIGGASQPGSFLAQPTEYEGPVPLEQPDSALYRGFRYV